MTRRLILARSMLGRPAVITSAPGPLASLLFRLDRWLDRRLAERSSGVDVDGPLTLPPARLNRRTLRPCPGVTRRVR